MLQKGKEFGSDDSFLSLLNDVSGISTANMPYRGYTLIGSQSDMLEVQHLQATGRPLWYVCSGKWANGPFQELLYFIFLFFVCMDFFIIIPFV